MQVKTFFRFVYKFLKFGHTDFLTSVVTVSVSYGVYHRLYQISATSNINYGEFRHRTEKRFSLP